MEITNIFDFDSRIKYLNDTSISKDITSSIKEQSNYMSSKDVNSNFSFIEDSLNSLYERFRVLEECIEYAKIYVNNEIDTAISDCKSVLNEIEKLNDMYISENSYYTVTNVPLQNNDIAQHTDRDGTVLQKCSTYNYLITLSGTVKEKIAINSILVNSTNQIYENNQDSLKVGSPYRTQYFLDDIPNDGVTETITINFEGVKTINSIKFALSNCDILSIIYVYDDNTETIEEDLSSGIIPAKLVKSVKLKINSKNYSVQTVSVRANTDNFFDRLSQSWHMVYDNIKEYDSAIGKTAYELDFNKYLESIAKEED